MACIIKLPTNDSPGVVSFTTQEEQVIRNDPKTLLAYKSIRDRFLTILHHNWHNYNFKPDDLFDVHMAGEDDLRVINGFQIHQIPMDACNFVRPEFRPSTTEKMWDVFFAGNPVFFKDPISFLNAIRDIYNQGRLIRVLYICPMPDYSFFDRKTVVYDIRKIYESMFNQEEQMLFNMVNLYHNYPRFFDRETLAHFYKSSKVFIHTAPEERRCRVAGYAWATGNPVVGKSCVGSLLPDRLRKPPYFYLVKKNEDFAPQLLKALDEYDAAPQPDSNTVREFNSTYTVPKLEGYLRVEFARKGWSYSGKILSKNLDHRLGRHHGYGISTNTVNQSLLGFIQCLRSLSQDTNEPLVQSEWPEESLFDSKSLVPDLNRLPLSYRTKRFVLNLARSILLNFK
jgi:hypothetical protein